MACASASIAPEEELAPLPAGGSTAAKPGLVAPPAAISQQADNLGDDRQVEPASLPSIGNAGEELEPASPALAGTDQVASDISSGDIPSGVPQSEPAGAVAAEETTSAFSSKPVPEPLQAPATGSEDASPQIALPKAPAFTLTSASGEPFSLETYRGESKVVLVFFRGFW